MTQEVTILSRDFWFKIVGMLQQNWVLIDPNPKGGVIAFFIQDRSGVFDQLQFSSKSEADIALQRNGFSRYAEDEGAKKFIKPPTGPFFVAQHPNGPIYSSGKFWK